MILALVLIAWVALGVFNYGTVLGYFLGKWPQFDPPFALALAYGLLAPVGLLALGLGCLMGARLLSYGFAWKPGRRISPDEYYAAKYPYSS